MAVITQISPLSEDAIEAYIRHINIATGTKAPLTAAYLGIIRAAALGIITVIDDTGAESPSSLEMQRQISSMNSTLKEHAEGVLKMANATEALIEISQKSEAKVTDLVDALPNIAAVVHEKGAVVVARMIDSMTTLTGAVHEMRCQIGELNTAVDKFGAVAREKPDETIMLDAHKPESYEFYIDCADTRGTEGRLVKGAKVRSIYGGYPLRVTSVTTDGDVHLQTFSGENTVWADGWRPGHWIFGSGDSKPLLPGDAAKDPSETAPLGSSAMSAAVTKSASDFERAIAAISAKTGWVGDDLKRVEDRARALGFSTAYSATETAEKMLDFIGGDPLRMTVDRLIAATVDTEPPERYLRVGDEGLDLCEGSAGDVGRDDYCEACGAVEWDSTTFLGVHIPAMQDHVDPRLPMTDNDDGPVGPHWIKHPPSGPCQSDAVEPCTDPADNMPSLAGE